MRNCRRIFLVVVLVASFAFSAFAHEPVHWDVVRKIREEGFQRSQVMDIVGYMTDVVGPRLSGSPNMRKAQQWAKKKMDEIGLANTAIEPWGEHGVNWDNEYTSIHMLKPDYQPLFGYPLAFTPGTNGRITGEAVIVVIKNREDLEEYRGTLQNAIVLISPLQEARPRFEADAVRRSREELERMSQAEITVPGEKAEIDMIEISREYFERMLLSRDKKPDTPLRVTAGERAEFFKSEGVRVLLQAGRGGDGTVVVTARPGSRRDRSLEAVYNAIPMVSIVPEHYNRMFRILERGMPVTIEIEIRNKLDDSDTKEYNVVGEIPGSDPAQRDELVMIGGHYDSWHTGTGATDNAAGCAVAMEAMRILKEIGAKPHRTIRIALWSHEEGGLHGSREYVREHFGDPRKKTTPAYDNFSVYFNMDNGTGQFRGIYLQGNEFVRPIFTEWMKPFHDLGMTTVTINNTGGTDHLSFDRAGLPGFQFIQDEIAYGTRTHHTNMDVYDSLIPKDLMKNAVIMASFAYHAAMRDEKIPRKPFATPSSK